jgi:ribosomal protein L37AE/L43A
MTKYFDSINRGKTLRNDKVVIDVDAYDEDRVKEWQCPYCNFRLHARKSRREIDCPNCTATLDLGGATQETKTIEDPNKSKAASTEVYAATTPDPNEQYMKKKELQLKDGALALSRKGSIRFTSYVDSSAGKEGAD